MAGSVELIMMFHPLGGQDISVLAADFDGLEAAQVAIARALDERRSLVLAHARYDREADENLVVVNLANVVAVRVSTLDSGTTGQDL